MVRDADPSRAHHDRPRMPLRYGDFYPAMTADFLVAHSCIQELGGYPGCDGEFDGEVVRVSSRFLVYVSARVCEWPEPSRRRPVASLWFLVDEKNGTRSFAVETESLIGALENFAPSLSRRDRRPRTSLAAIEVHDLGDDDHVVAGSTLHLALMAVQVKASGDTDEPRLPTDGIRFEIGAAPSKPAPLLTASRWRDLFHSSRYPLRCRTPQSDLPNRFQRSLTS
jgi:hypothetical protein